MKNIFTLTLSLVISFHLFSQQRDIDNIGSKATANTKTPDEVVTALFKGDGLYRDYKPSDELVELRTRNAKHFLNPDGSVTEIIGAGDLHYFEDGEWKEILTHILPNNTGEYVGHQFAAVYNQHKNFFPETPGMPIVTKLRNEVYQDWEHPSMVWLDANANVIAEYQPNVLATGVPVKDSIRYANIFPHTDAVILNTVTSKKLSYFLRDSSILADKPAGAVYLAFRETIHTNSSWKLSGTASSEKIFASLDPESVSGGGRGSLPIQ